MSNIEYVYQIVHFVIPYINLHTQRYNFFFHSTKLFFKKFSYKNDIIRVLFKGRLIMGNISFVRWAKNKKHRVGMWVVFVVLSIFLFFCPFTMDYFLF